MMNNICEATSVTVICVTREGDVSVLRAETIITDTSCFNLILNVFESVYKMIKIIHMNECGRHGSQQKK